MSKSAVDSNPAFCISTEIQTVRLFFLQNIQNQNHVLNFSRKHIDNLITLF
jgi:hypothetical protein